MALLVGALSLVGCSQTVRGNCAGWTKGPLPRDAVSMVKKEPEVSRWLVSHNRFGFKSGCWD